MCVQNMLHRASARLFSNLFTRARRRSLIMDGYWDLCSGGIHAKAAFMWGNFCEHRWSFRKNQWAEPYNLSAFKRVQVGKRRIETSESCDLIYERSQKTRKINTINVKVSLRISLLRGDEDGKKAFCMWPIIAFPSQFCHKRWSHDLSLVLFRWKSRLFTFPKETDSTGFTCVNEWTPSVNKSIHARKKLHLHPLKAHSVPAI